LSLSLRCRADNDAKSVAFGGGSISDPGKPNTSHVKQAGITYRTMNFIEWVGWEGLEKKASGLGKVSKVSEICFNSFCRGFRVFGWGYGMTWGYVKPAKVIKSREELQNINKETECEGAAIIM